VHLTGRAGLVRLEGALVDACVKFEEAVKNGPPLPSPISSPVMCKSYPVMPNLPVFVSLEKIPNRSVMRLAGILNPKLSAPVSFCFKRR
jgi:hypothetical protein